MRYLCLSLAAVLGCAWSAPAPAGENPEGAKPGDAITQIDIPEWGKDKDKPWEKRDTPMEHFFVPKDYTPEKAWPLVYTVQEKVARAQIAPLPYFVTNNSTYTSSLLLTARKYRLDPLRIYGTAFSRSGHGMLEAAWTHPDRYAAIVPLCEDLRPKDRPGYPKEKLLKYIQQTPVYLLHATGDSFRKTGTANYEYMKENGCPVRFGLYPGYHTPLPVWYYKFDVITGFFDKHVLDPYPKRVVHVIYRPDASRAFWVDALAAKPANDQPYPDYEVKVADGNVIEVKGSAEVKQLIFHLNDKILDMNKPVKVTAEGKELYNGKAEPKLTVTLHEGAAANKEDEPPMWERLAALYTQPNETGACDWLYLAMPTVFKDSRQDVGVERVAHFDLGVRAAGAPATARIDWASKQHRTLAVNEPKSSASFSLAGLPRKLPLEVTAETKRFSFTGVCESPDGKEPPKLVAPGEGKSGEVILVKMRMANKGKEELQCVAELNRSAFTVYPWGTLPKSPEGAKSFYGIWEIAGTKDIHYMWIGHGNEAAQLFGFFFLNPAEGAKLSLLGIPDYPWAKPGVCGVKAEFALKPGETKDVPLLLIAANPPDPKGTKPACPDLAKLVEDLRPALTEALASMGGK